ncbi:hypothetical protein RDI58_011110 [Solanum bulbocastanum]|uniref:Uncharacterized protein n=1 Tax=Solanum bulbocastanum TaxID=147425 RepID=A0AAN8TQP5_SOLBU
MLDLYANKLPNYVDKSKSDPLEVKHMKCVPQQEESSSIGVFDMRSIDINAKYHLQRYATIMWHYGRTRMMMA